MHVPPNLRREKRRVRWAGPPGSDQGALDRRADSKERTRRHDRSAGVGSGRARSRCDECHAGSAALDACNATPDVSLAWTVERAAMSGAEATSEETRAFRRSSRRRRCRMVIAPPHFQRAPRSKCSKEDRTGFGACLASDPAGASHMVVNLRSWPQSECPP